MTKINLVFRYDDFAASSDTALEKKLFSLFREHGFSCLVGVVPFEDASESFGPDYRPLHPDKVRILREAANDGVIEVALHGYTHQCLPRVAKEGWTEFEGVKGEQQQKMLSDGKQALEALTEKPVRTFIPPYNSYDEQTILAMSNTGLSILSAAMFDHAPSIKGIAYVPHTCDLFQVRKAIEGAQTSGKEDVIIMALFHAFDFVESDQARGRFNLSDVANLLSWISTLDDVKVVRVENVVKMMNCGPERYSVNKAYLWISMNRFVPNPGGVLWQRLYYLDSSEAVFRSCYLVLRTLFVYGVTCLIGIFIGILFGGLGATSVSVGYYVFTCVLLINLVWFTYLIWRGQRIYYRATQVSCNLISMLIAFLVAWQGGIQ